MWERTRDETVSEKMERVPDIGRYANKKYMSKERLKKNVTLKLNEHQISLDQLCTKLATDAANGLTLEQVNQNLVKYGKNIETPTIESHQFSRFFVHNFQGLSANAWIGIVVCLTTFLVEAFANVSLEPNIENVYLGLSMTFFVLINGTVYYIIERKALGFLKSMKSEIEHHTIVIRDGKRSAIGVRDLTVGDLVEIQAGDRIPADIRVTKSTDFKVDNSGLTGISKPTQVKPNSTNDNPLLAGNLIFFNTFALEGTCQGIVFNVGDRTVVGHVKRHASTIKQVQTLLSKSIIRIIVVYSVIGMWLSLAFCIYYIRAKLSWLETTIIFIAVYFACVPEQLLMSAVVSLTLAGKGLRRHNCLPKHFHEIETIGLVEFICIDKTGVLTENKLTVSHIWMGHSVINVLDKDSFEEMDILGGFKALLRCMTLCAKPAQIDSETNILGENEFTKTQGLHKALNHFAKKRSQEIDYQGWTENILIHETIFNSTSKYCLSVHNIKEHSRQICVIVGSPEIILHHCTTMIVGSKQVPVTKALRVEFEDACDEMGRFGEKVFGFGDYFLNTDFTEKDQMHKHSFRFLGLVSMVNNPRASIPNAIAKCRSASIKVILISRDLPATVIAIAKDVGLISHEYARIFDGKEVHNMSPQELDFLISTNDEIVFANTSPHHKLWIVKSCQRLGGKVAVTGQDVSDCPALKSADIAVALDFASDVVKQCADVILLDNSLSSLVAGVEQGRLIYENLVKCVMYSLTSAVPQIVPFLLFMILEIPRPLGAFSVLLITISTDLLPVLSLVYEKPEYDLMKKAPMTLNRIKLLLDPRVLRRAYFQIGLLETLAGMFAYIVVLVDNGFLPSYLIGLSRKWDSPAVDQLVDSYGQEWNHFQRKELEFSAHTAFCFAVILTQIANVLSCKTRVVSLFRRLFKNWVMNAAVVFAFAMGIFVSNLPEYISESQKMRRLISFYWYLPSVPFVIFIFCLEEFRRYMIRKFPNGWVRLEFGY